MIYRVNLLPVELQPKPPLSARKFLSYLLCTVMFALVGFGYGYFHMNLTSFKEELHSLQQSEAQLQLTQEKLSETSKQQQAMKNQISTYNHLLHQRATWPKLLYEVNGKVPEGVWLTKLNLSYINPDEVALQDQQNQSQENHAIPGQAKENNAEEAKEEAAQPASPEQNNPPGNSQNGQIGNQTTQDKVKVPEFPPNTALIEGGSYSMESIGRFMYSLNQLKYLSKVELIEIVQDNEGKYTFKIEAPLKEAQS